MKNHSVLTIAELQVLQKAALSFSKACRKNIVSFRQDGFDSSIKNDKSIVTTADLTTEKLFRNLIKETFPTHGVIGEEFDRTNPESDFQWIIDPIDGTAEFAAGLPTYGSIIGLHHNKTPIIGVIDHPALDKTYWAAKGLGAYCNDKKLTIVPFDNDKIIDGSERLAITSKDNFLRSGNQLEVFNAITDKHPNIRINHSCFTHTAVAAGGYDAMLEWDLKLWDIAATQILIEEAGGVFKILKGDDLIGDPTQRVSAIFGQEKLVDSVCELLEGMERV